VRNQSRARKTLLLAPIQDLLDESEHPILIEVPVAQVRVFPVPQLKLTTRLRGIHVDGD
jgi:hypothetical protein